MKIAYFDCIAGVSGDMILGTLVSCGVPIEYLKKELGKLHITGFDLTSSEASFPAISATHVEVNTEPQHEHRHLSTIRDIISSSTLSPLVKEQAIRIFTNLAEAEARVHNTTPDKVHFHEVGALDAIVDVVGACIGLEYLKVDKIISSPLRLGTGTVKCAHGIMPVPVPAVVELTKGIPVVITNIVSELTTPTGAAILTTLAASYGSPDSFIIENVGYGAGSRVLKELPNVLRIMVGEEISRYEEDECLLLETNIDNMNPEVFGYLMDRLFEAGAKDVYMIPIYMKKGRPGTLLSTLTDESLVETLLDILFAETTTLGVRITRVTRKKLPRKTKTIETEFGPMRVKTASVNGRERFSPEYEDCARIARERGIPLITVYDVVRSHLNPND